MQREKFAFRIAQNLFLRKMQCDKKYCTSAIQGSCQVILPVDGVCHTIMPCGVASLAKPHPRWRQGAPTFGSSRLLVLVIVMALTVPRPDSLLRPLIVPRLTMMGPGPVACAPRVLASFSHQMLPTFACNDSLVTIMADIRQGLQYVMQTSSPYTFAVSGAAHAAMECALVNTLEPGEVALVTVHGLWGERASEIADRHGK